jgi:hypothetical protein
VAGKTEVQVLDTNKGPGVLNKQGIPVIYVNGPGVNGDEFFLKHPIDTGFFNYDLFFRPTGSGGIRVEELLRWRRLRSAAARDGDAGSLAPRF